MRGFMLCSTPRLFEMWNERFNRWVNRGAHGIALITDRDGRPYLRHVFDVKDTHSRDEKDFNLWELRQGSDKDMITALENSFGELDRRFTLMEAVMSAVRNICEDNLTDYFGDLIRVSEGSALGRYDEDALRKKFHQLLQDSVAFSVTTRLGFEAHEYLAADAFDKVTEFNTPATINCLGCATGDLSELCLREIEKAVRIFDKNKIRTFDSRGESGYNGGENTNTTENGGNEHGIHDDKRREHPEPDAAGDAGTTAGQVRDDAAGISDEAPQGDLHDASDRSEADRASVRDGTERESTDQGEYLPTGDEPWGDGTDESGEPDGVGADDEQHQADSRGGNPEQPDLRVNNQPPRLMPDDLIQILRHGDYLTHSKAEIVSFLSQETDDAKKTAYIRECYPKLTASMYRTGTKEYLGYSGLFDDGLHVFAGTFMNPSAAEVLDWDFARKLIEALIHDKNYLDEPRAGEQITMMDAVAETKPEKTQFRVSQEVIDELLRLGGCTRNSTKRIYGFFRRSGYPTEVVDFLKHEYERDAVGLIVGDRKASAIWDENGIRIAEGESVYGAENTVLLSWDEVAGRIRELLETGQYLPQNEADQADATWRDYVADRIADLYRDRFSEIPAEYKTQSRFIWPEITQFYSDILSDSSRIEPFTREISENIGRVDSVTDSNIRWRTPMAYTLMLAKSFLREPIPFPPADNNLLPPLTYVSEDKINDYLLSYGSGSTGGKYRIYSYFLQHSDAASRAKFLAGEFGTGGSGGGRLDTSHDGKGLALSKGMLKDREHRVLLTWTQVAKRIDGLIKSDRYMSEDELSHLDDYEKEQIARRIVGFYSNQPLDVPRPYETSSYDDFDKYKQVIPQLEDRNRVAEIISMMQGVLDNEMPGSHYYQYDKNALESVKSFRDGTFNLFPGAKGRENRPTMKMPETEQTPIAKEAEDTEPDEIESDEAETDHSEQPQSENNPSHDETKPFEYDLHLGTDVYIGKTECTITSMADGKVELFDGTLIPLELTMEQFMSRIRENPLNNHLKIGGQAEPEVTEVKSEVPTEPKPEKAPRTRKGKQPEKSLTEKIQDEYDRWQWYMDGNGSDPSWEDDANMNLIRNHIISYREQLLKESPDGTVPEICQRELPPIMPRGFMAKPEMLREKAQEALAVLSKNEDYLWCKANVDKLTKKEQDKVYAPTVIGYITRLEKAIKDDNLLTMRLYRNYESYYETFETCRSQMEKILEDRKYSDKEQDIFDSLMVEGEEPENEDTEQPEEEASEEVSEETKPLPAEEQFVIPSAAEQYDILKAKQLEYIAAVKVGDFYEFYGTDAEKVAGVLGLMLTSKSFGEKERRPMCGFPVHKLDDYLRKLINTDLKVAFIDDEKSDVPFVRISTEETSELEQAKEYIADFCGSEYGSQVIDFDDLTKVSIAYTTITDEEYPVQVNVDLVNFKLLKYLGETLVEETQYATLKELNDKALSNLDFDSLVSVSDEQLEKYRESISIAVPTMMAEDKPKPKAVLQYFHPELPDEAKHDFRITDVNLGVGGAKEKFQRNMVAIELLQMLEQESRVATPEEQAALAQYTGWGGLADAFEPEKDSWHSEYNQLKNALTPEEYEAARESTLTAFYTPPTVIRAIYTALGNMGFVRGNILEPSCGIGNFIGMITDKMRESKVYGVELDSISGRIAQQLYQHESITVSGFENTAFPDSFFDVAVGNVPFGQFKVGDKKYDKYNFLIHDYFFAKTLDKVRPGGVIAFITSKGTLDKENPSVRKYIAQRADLIGAIRLPDTIFKASAGTEAVADILFLQKRDRIIDVEPDWVHLGKDENGIPMNQYFVDNPDMIMGEMVMRSGPFGQEPTCRAYDGQDLGDLLNEAVANIHAEMDEVERDEQTEEDGSIPADPNVRNFSYTVVDGKVYYRQNSVMNPVATTVTGENRIKGMVALRDIVRALIDAQLENYPDEAIEALQAKLNTQYDEFTKKYGLINSRGNESAFSDDNSYFLLCSLEILNDEKQLERKADFFTKRTIKPKISVKSVETASEALAVSMAERAYVDLDYMSELTGKGKDEITKELEGVIFPNPEPEHDPHADYLTADEYLSGNVRAKLDLARRTDAEFPEEYAANVKALEAVQPQDLTAGEIGVKLGTTWIPQEDVQDFVYELLETPYWSKRRIQVKYIPATAQWLITDKSYDSGNIKAYSVYGTQRINAYGIIEETLNQKDIRIFDYVQDAEGNKKAVFNRKETTIAQGKQDQIKRKFEDWIWKDPARRERLCKLYNEKFNSTRPREYDGKHIQYYGMNPEISLRPHQSNAVARIMYGGNTLLAHVVGAGKTYTMTAAAQESKRLGLCSKSMFVVPNHLISQWASEYLQLYPSANILVATKKDFETQNRKKFCARIATGDYDAIIIGHSQFEKIPMSLMRQQMSLQKEIDELTEGITDLKYERGERMTVKQLMKMRKQLERKLEKLNDQSRKDDVVCFEELGIDRLFVDEAHNYKNLFVFSKMRNVAGISQTEAQKSSDLYMKCRYLDELTGNRGVVFATGTPISNSMVELYTMQRYLQYDELKLRGLSAFDAWASTFGETVSAIEIAPDGSGYRAKVRFAKFFNLPELMAMFKQVADIQTADMLHLPVPEAHYHVVSVEASDIQKDLVQSFADRAERVRAGMVKSNEDNMLVITNDGRKAALDQRLIDPDLPDFEGSKVNTCLQEVYEIWERNADKKSAQLVFCDISTPHGDGKFNVYDDLRDKLIAKGVPAEEIAFIHQADTDVRKKELFGKVRSGQVRILLGSTAKMGAGTNVQKRLIAIHDLDCPWRPSDLEQRAGRIVRQGNSNPEVDILRYVTKGTFDSYMYQLLESKQKFISQIMTSKSPVRVAEDIDETALSYAEIKALASGNPKILEKMKLDADVVKLKLQKASHLSQRYMLEDKVLKSYPREIAETEERIRGYDADIETINWNTFPNENGFSPMTIMDKVYTERADAGKAILEICQRITNPEPRPLGAYRGLQTDIGFDTLQKEFFISLRGKMIIRVPLGKDASGIITRLDNAVDSYGKRRDNCQAQLAELQKQVENAKAEIEAPFPAEAELEDKCKRLDALNAELNMDKRENELADNDPEQDDDTPAKDEPDKDDDREDR